jgi:hypothetical protein
MGWPAKPGNFQERERKEGKEEGNRARPRKLT